jgi:LAS superfamily LD-carboxypeptidase LdcB
MTFVCIGAAVMAGAIAFGNTIATRQPLQGADLRRLVQFPAPNADSKTDRLPVVSAAYNLLETVDAATPPAATASVAPASQYAAIDPASAAGDGRLPDPIVKPALTAIPAPLAKPKATAVKPARPTNVVLNDAQIAALKQRLRLSPSQEPFWPEIELALRDVVKQIYEANRKAHGATVPVDTTTAEVERLKSAAMPLLMQMRADQKAEIIALAHIIGMEKLVAML